MSNYFKLFNNFIKYVNVKLTLSFYLLFSKLSFINLRIKIFFNLKKTSESTSLEDFLFEFIFINILEKN